MTGKFERDCKKCGINFSTNDNRKIYCTRDCYRTDWVKMREYDYQSTYGISIAEYNELFTEQDGCCAICDRHQSEFKRRLAVDHCHDKGRIRGLLCHNCNLALGRFMESPEILKSALEYVK